MCTALTVNIGQFDGLVHEAAGVIKAIESILKLSFKSIVKV